MSRGVNRRSETARWLWTYKRTPEKEITHLSFSGGVFAIPPDKEPELLALLAKDYYFGNPNYLIEYRTPLFRFHLDLDFFWVAPLSFEELQEYMRTIQEVIRDFYSDTSLHRQELRLILCTNDNKQQKKEVLVRRFQKRSAVDGSDTENIVGVAPEERTLVKTALHCIWPGIVVSQQEALFIRAGLIQKLKLVHGERTLKENVRGTLDGTQMEWESVEIDKWEEIVDITVFEENGLRMVGSNKGEKCKECRRRGKNEKGKNDCANCDGTGYLDCGRPYRPAHVVDATGDLCPDALDALEKDPVFMFKETSIRFHEADPPFMGNEPSWLVLEADTRRKIDEIIIKHSKTGKKKRKRKRIGDDTLGTTTSRPRITYRIDNPDDLDLPTGASRIVNIPFGKVIVPCHVFGKNTAPYAFISHFVNNHFPNGTTGALHELQDVKIAVDKSKMVAKSNSRWCANVRREHNSNTVYFMSDGRYIWQRCFSKKGTCPRFPGMRKSNPQFYHEMPSRFRKKFFQLYERGNHSSRTTTTTTAVMGDESTLPQQRRGFNDLDLLHMYDADLGEDSFGESDSPFAPGGKFGVPLFS